MSAEPTSEAPVESEKPYNVNIGVSAGIDNPAGIVGLEAEYRIHQYFSAGIAGGIGLWGPRISPNAKLEYQFNDATGIFLEAALSINTGGEGYTEENGQRQEFKMLMTPTASVSFGGRVRAWGPFWTGARVGINMPLRKDNVEIVGGGAPTSLTQGVTDLAQPGGIVAAVTAGFSI
jgi:hypothetical protein